MISHPWLQTINIRKLVCSYLIGYGHLDICAAHVNMGKWKHVCCEIVQINACFSSIYHPLTFQICFSLLSFSLEWLPSFLLSFLFINVCNLQVTLCSFFFFISMSCILLLLCSYYSRKTEPLFLLWSTKWCACQLKRLLCFLQMMMQCHTCENGKGVWPLCGWLSSALPVTASPWIICTRAPTTVHYGCNGKPQPGKIQSLSCGKLRLMLLIQLNTCSGLKPSTEIKIFCCTYIKQSLCI